MYRNLLQKISSFRTNHVLNRHFNKIVITDDGTTIVALHQDQEFPYQYSKPLPVESTEDNSILKMNNLEEVQRVFIDVKPEIARQQLCNLTLTTKHRWFPRARDKRITKIEMNRPYL